MAAAVLLATSSSMLVNLAHAGAGWADSTDAGNKPIKVPTYYANSPSGLRTDQSPTPGAAMIDTGAPLRKFVDSLPGLGAGAANNLGQYIPQARPEKWIDPNGVTTNDDYYEIGIVEYAEQMHSDLPKKTTLRGYVQLGTKTQPGTVALTYPDGIPILDASGVQLKALDNPHYLGPMIVASRGTPVRIKYYNLLPKGHFAAGRRNGDLFLPVDKTLMGAGTGARRGTEMYTENRAGIHLHGGDNPWISDGTPHQWITPAGEKTSYAKGASFANVPDMPDPGSGSGTLYYPNGDGARLMFYHDHSAGITRLNVYAGEAAAYLLNEPAVETQLGLPADQIPLVIQDRTYVPKDVALQDAKWDTAHWGLPGDLWYPHVYETNQDPNSFDGTNPPGRWDYGPWFWPIFPAPLPLPDGSYGNVSTVPEAFGDTPIVNGTAYPSLTVEPKAYRLRVLNAANDRMFNLGLYVADPLAISVVSGGSAYTAAATVAITPNPNETNAGAGAGGATATATVVGGAIAGITVTNPGSGYTLPPTVTITDTAGSGAAAVAAINTEVKMVAAVPPPPTLPLCSAAGAGPDPATGLPVGVGVSCWPDLWPTDGRDGGVPDPRTAGPQIVQIGSEGGLLPAPAIIPSTPVNYEYDRRSVTVLNVSTHGLFIGPAERADVVVDFSRYAGKTLILYNDSPTPVPAFDPRVDYYTDNPDLTGVGGAPSSVAGFGPNTRTIMQIKVANTAPASAFDVPSLAAALPKAYRTSQPQPVVAELAYNPVSDVKVAGNTYARIFTGSLNTPTFNFTAGDSLTYKPWDPVKKTILSTSKTVAAGSAVSDFPVLNKAIQELFDPNYGRMNATLGVELPYTSSLIQTTIPLGFIDPVTEKIDDGETQLWKITHNGVDTHPVHFHLVNVQVINRVGWDGTLKPPADNELGWKETVKMNPLEDIIVAVRAKAPKLSFGVPNSVRLMDPTQPAGVATGFTQVDPLTGNPATVTNQMVNFGWEYVWHCHILGHEENDFMRPVVFNYQNVVPNAPSGLAMASGILSWTDPTPSGAPTTLGNAKNEIGFRIQQSVNNAAFKDLATTLANQTRFTLSALSPNTKYVFRVVAFNAAGDSLPSNTVTQAPPNLLLAPTNLTARYTASRATVGLSWGDASSGETGYVVQRATVTVNGNTGALTTGSYRKLPNTNSVLAPNLSRYDDAGVTGNTLYSYQVGAVNGATTGPVSQVYVASAAAPAAPGGFSIGSATTSSLKLNWNGATGFVTGYEIQRCTVTRNSCGAWTPVTVLSGYSKNTYTDTRLATRTTYQYRIRSLVSALPGYVSAWVISSGTTR